MVATIKLKRISAGHYETRDGSHEIVQGSPGSSWAGQWIVRSTSDRTSYTDTIATLAECRAHLAAKAAS